MFLNLLIVLRSIDDRDVSQVFMCFQLFKIHLICRQIQIIGPEVKAWDMFRVLPPEQDRSAEKSEERVQAVLRFVKLLAIIIVFILVLGGGVVAKGTLLFMTSQLDRNHEVEYCNRELDLSKLITKILLHLFVNCRMLF